MKLLLSTIDQAPLDTLLTYFKVQRRDEQPEKDKKASYSIREMIEITRGQYGHETFKSFFN